MKQIEWVDFPIEPAGDILDSGTVKELEQAKQAGLKYIAGRMHTRREVKEYLQKKGYAGELVQEVLSFLDEYGYLDDAVYCRSWIHDRIQFHPCGRQKMAAELAKKISDKALIQQSLEEYFPNEIEAELALNLALKKIRSSRSIPRRDQLARFLYTKGFSGSVVSHILQDETVCETLNKTGFEDNTMEEDF